MKRSRMSTILLTSIALLASAAISQAQSPRSASVSRTDSDESKALVEAGRRAERQLHQTFTNLHFEDFAPAPIKGQIYQASAGGRILYYAPESDHLLFATVYDRNGLNLTALAQSARAEKQLSVIDPTKALVIGPPDAPSVIEFTDPDCPDCQALERYWITKAAEGRPVKRLIYFVSGIHPQAAAKAEHIFCSPDPTATFKALYAGASPPSLATCSKGHAKVEADAALVAKVGVSGTPTLILDGKIVSGFQQGEIETFLASHAKAPAKAVAPPSVTPKAPLIGSSAPGH